MAHSARGSPDSVTRAPGSAPATTYHGNPETLAVWDWLIGELERFGEPADVLGHDWGGVFVILERGVVERVHDSCAFGRFSEARVIRVRS